MEIVIDIDEGRYNQIKRCADKLLASELECAIKNGTPLPKGHGRLIDGSWAEQFLRQKLLKYGIFPQYKQGLEIALNDVIKIAPTIIEESKESER